MKRISIIAALILATVAIVSCSQGSGDNPYGKKILRTSIQVDASEDLIAASDIEITYKGQGGIDVTDTITSTSWKKTIDNDTFPTEVGIVNYRMLVKPDTKFDKDRCQLGLKLKCLSTPMSLLNMPIVDWTESPIDIDDIASSKVAAYLEMKELAPGLFNDGWRGFHSLVQKVIINNGKFEVENTDVNSEESNEQ